MPDIVSAQAASVTTGAGGSSPVSQSRPGASGGVEIKRAVEGDVPVAAGADLRQTFVITNSGPAAVIDLGQVRSPAGAQIPSVWTDVGANERVSKPYAAPANSQLVLAVSAKASGSGRYAVPITVRVGEARRVYEFAIERRTRLPASGVFTVRKEPAQIDTGFLPFVEREARVAFDVTNSGPAAVQIRQPFIRAATHTSGGRVSQADLKAADGAITCDGSQTTARPVLVDLPRDRTCEGVVKTPIRWPGAYALTVSANGAGPEDGQASVDVLLNVRAHVLWAILIAAAGAVIGSLVSRWQTQGRAKAMAQLAIAVENERVADIAKAAKAFGYVAPVAGVAAALEALWNKVDDDPKTDVATPLAALRSHLGLIRRWLDLLDDIQELPQAAQAPLRAQAEALADTLEPVDPPNAGLDAALATVAAGIQAAGPGGGAGGGAVAPAPMIPRPADLRRTARRMKGPARQIAGFVKRTDILVDLLLGVGVCTAAIMTSWLVNPTWGGLGDVIALVTATFTVQTGGALLARPQPSSVQ